MQELYAKFRILGANVEKLKKLGLAIPELEGLLARLESVHDKRLVRLITGMAQLHHTPVECASNAASSKNVIKTCPRCTRDLTETNIIRDHHSDDFNTFVLVCECGYLREIKNSTLKVAA
jgi:hypothetical protein